jgi:hypothetical protein
MPWKPYDWPDDKPPGTFTSQPWVPKSISLVKWSTKGPNCPACNTLKGRIYPLAYWQATVMPGWHDHCDCRLVYAGTAAIESPHDLWGTEPYWWNPLQSPFEYIAELFKRFSDYFSNRMEGDAYSGFDVLHPVFQSQSGFTTAGWTLLNYSINITSLNGIVGNTQALLTINQQNLSTCLPWESYTPWIGHEPD